MAKYATGKYARAISDRSGMEFPYKEMVENGTGPLSMFQSSNQNNHN